MLAPCFGHGKCLAPNTYTMHPGEITLVIAKVGDALRLARSYLVAFTPRAKSDAREGCEVRKESPGSGGGRGNLVPAAIMYTS
jgi:hypothetical protein